MRIPANIRGGPPPSKKGFGGLRRLGTVLGRQEKSSKGMDRPPSPDKRSRPGRNPLRRGLSSRQDMQQIDSPPQTSSSNLPSQAPQLGDPLIQTTTTRSANRPTSPPQAPIETSEISKPAIPTPAPVSTESMPNGVQNTRDLASVQEAPTMTQTLQPAKVQRDAEGYTVPSRVVDDITRAQQEAGASGDTDQNAFKLNIRDAPIREDDQVAQQTAFSSVANTLRAVRGIPFTSVFVH